MGETYRISCDCGAVSLELTGSPRVRGHCHCQACRTLLNVPFHSVTAWNLDQLLVTSGAENLLSFQHPRLNMKKAYCAACGEVLYNTNAMDWRVVSQHLIAKNRGGFLPEELSPLSHFHYSSRIVDIDDELPKKS